MLLITHYERLLDYVGPDRVHVLQAGQIERSGGPELARELEREGYAEAAHDRDRPHPRLHRLHVRHLRRSRQSGRAVADTALLVMLFGIIAIVDFVLSQFIDTGMPPASSPSPSAAALALDALYGLMAPERQKQRDKMLRRLMKRRA